MEGRGPCEDTHIETEIGVIHYKPRNAWDYQKLKEARKDPPLEASVGECPCQHLDLGSVTEYFSGVLSHPVCGTLLRQPSKTNTVR